MTSWPNCAASSRGDGAPPAHRPGTAAGLRGQAAGAPTGRPGGQPAACMPAFPSRARYPQPRPGTEQTAAGAAGARPRPNGWGAPWCRGARRWRIPGAIGSLTSRLVALAGTWFGIQTLTTQLMAMFQTGDQAERPQRPAQGGDGRLPVAKQAFRLDPGLRQEHPACSSTR